MAFYAYSLGAATLPAFLSNLVLLVLVAVCALPVPSKRP